MTTEDDNCSFISFEETANFNDWLVLNGNFIASDSLQENLIDKDVDPLLVQEEFHNSSDTETLKEYTTNGDFSAVKEKKAHTPAILRARKSKTDKNMNSLKKSQGNSRTLTKYEEIERVVKPGHQIILSLVDVNVNVSIKNEEDKEVLSDYFVKAHLLGYSFEKSQQLVKCVDKIELAPSVNVHMPCIIGEEGLHLFICPQQSCKEVYVRTTTAKIHALIHMNIKPYKCTVANCAWRFYSMTKLRRHIETHAKRKDFECKVEGCGKRFTTLYNLNLHKKKHDIPAGFECPVESCKEKFQSFRLCEAHLKTHDDSERSIVCTYPSCNKHFFTRQALNTHSRTHVYDKKDITCSQCGKVFKHPSRLKTHMYVHNGVRPYSCNYCDWSFYSSSKLKRHTASHFNDRKFQCNICSKSFLRSEHLKDHMEVHGNYVKCKVCSAIYVKSENYLHMETKHPEYLQKIKNSENCTQVSGETTSRDTLLEQAIQSLGVPSDMMLSSYINEEPSLEILDNESFSTVNLRDLE